MCKHKVEPGLKNWMCDTHGTNIHISQMSVYTKAEHCTISGHLTPFSKIEQSDSDLWDMGTSRRDNISAWLREWHHFLTGTRSCKTEDRNGRFSEVRVSPLCTVFLNRWDYFAWLWASLYSKRIASEIPFQPALLIPASLLFLSAARPLSHMHVISATRKERRKIEFVCERSVR